MSQDVSTELHREYSSMFSVGVLSRNQARRKMAVLKQDFQCGYCAASSIATLRLRRHP
jgi:hypothetical protein